MVIVAVLERERFGCLREAPMVIMYFHYDESENNDLDYE